MKQTKIPLIFTLVGALGVIATGALASYSTIKAVKILEEDNKQLKDISLNKETIDKTWKQFLVPGSVALVSVASIFLAQKINYKYMITLASMILPFHESYREYRDRVRREAPELDEKIITEMANEHYISPWGDDMGQKVTFYDPESDRTFERSWYEVCDAFYHFNRNFQLRGYGYLNELYEFLELETTTNGDIYGYYADWFYDSGLLPWIDWSVTPENHNGKTIYNIGLTWPPSNLKELDDGYPTIDQPEYFIAST